MDEDSVGEVLSGRRSGDGGLHSDPESEGASGKRSRLLYGLRGWGGNYVSGEDFIVRPQFPRTFIVVSSTFFSCAYMSRSCF